MNPGIAVIPRQEEGQVESMHTVVAQCNPTEPMETRVKSESQTDCYLLDPKVYWQQSKSEKTVGRETATQGNVHNTAEGLSSKCSPSWEKSAFVALRLLRLGPPCHRRLHAAAMSLLWWLDAAALLPHRPASSHMRLSCNTSERVNCTSAGNGPGRAGSQHHTVQPHTKVGFASYVAKRKPSQ